MFDTVSENQKYKILIVEDSMFNQLVLRNILESSYTLETADTAKKAFEKVRQFRPHLILLDIILPDANGFDILVTLKDSEETRDIPVIFITGLESDQDEEKGFLLGAVDYVKRPFKDAIIRARINTQIHIIKQIQTIEQLGLIDALTGIPNRRSFDLRIQFEWRRAIRDHTELSMLMLDIDKFKEYNDTYGHPQGDLMLQAVGKAIKSELKRSTDLFFRYGGEEFAVLLANASIEDALAVAARLITRIAKTEVPCMINHVITKRTVSIGAATMLPTESDHISVLVAKADRMLYKAKQSGRNQVQF